MKKEIYSLVTAIAILINPTLVIADPIVKHPVPLIAVPVILLPMEGVILVLLARKTKPFFWRFVGSWTIVTTITFVLLTTAIVTMGEPLVTGTFGEILLTLIEGLILYYLLQTPKFVRNPEAAPSLEKSILYSLAANAFSFIGGFIAVSIIG